MPPKNYPTEYQQRILWRAATGLSILTLGGLLVGMIWLGSQILSYLQPVLIPLAIAGIVAYLLDPLCRRLQRHGFSRMKAILTVFSGIILGCGILIYTIADPLSAQIGNIFSKKNNDNNIVPSSYSAADIDHAKQNKAYGWLVAKAFEKDGEAVREARKSGTPFQLPSGGTWIPEDPDTPLPKALAGTWSSEVALANFGMTKVGVWLTNFSNKSVSWLLTSGGALIGGKILGFLGVIIGIAMVPIYLYYFLKESNSIQSSWHDYIPLRASHFKDEVVETLAEVNGYLISFFRGQVLVAFIDGILVGIALSIFQLPYGLLIGIFMALLGIIPYIGNILCLIPACIIAFIHGASEPFGIPQWGYVVGVVAIFVIVQQINSLVTAPKIVGDSVGLHPMTVIFSMLFWSLILGGFLGALLAVPLTAAVKVLFRRYIWQRKIADAPTSPRPLDPLITGS